MVGGRQLPPWMVRSNAANQEGISEIKEENNEAGSEEVDNKACKASKKTQRKQYDMGVSLLDKNSHLLKKCDAKGSKGKSIKQDEDKGDDIDESVQEKKGDTVASKRCQQGNEILLNKCGTKGRKRMSRKQRDDEGGDFYESGMENAMDVPPRKVDQHNPPRRKKQKQKDLMEGSHYGKTECIEHQYNASRKKKQKETELDISHDQTESISSDDELTVEDLIIIAEEYMNAEKEELQILQNVGFESDAKSLYTTTSKIRSNKDLTTNLENMNSAANSSGIEPLHSGGSVTNPIGSGDSAREMLDLFLGPLLKTSEQVERQADTVTEKLMFDHELSQRSQNDKVEVGPVWKKNSSLKDRIAVLLD